MFLKVGQTKKKDQLKMVLQNSGENSASPTPSVECLSEASTVGSFQVGPLLLSIAFWSAMVSLPLFFRADFFCLLSIII